MTSPLRIAVAGLGTVGGGLLKLIVANAEPIAARCGRAIAVTAVSARDRHKDRGLELNGIEWYDDAATMAQQAQCDVVVELIGGMDGVARRVVDVAIARGKHVVTANKALLAHAGTVLAHAAEANAVVLAYEAAVAGGIPIIKLLREGLAANRAQRI